MNVDPIETFVRWVFGGSTGLSLGIAALVAAACLQNLMGQPWRQRERRSVRESRVLANRILGFLPVYEREMAEHVAWARQRVAASTPLVRLATALSPQAKVEAEKKFCLYDSGKLEAVSLFQMELNQMLRKNKEA